MIFKKDSYDKALSLKPTDIDLANRHGEHVRMIELNEIGHTPSCCWDLVYRDAICCCNEFKELNFD